MSDLQSGFSGTIVGRVGKAPEGTDKVQKFTVAVNQGKDKDGKDRPTIWIQAVAFSRYVNFVRNYIKPGDQVTIIGDVEMDVSEDGGKQWWKIIVGKLYRGSASKKGAEEHAAPSGPAPGRETPRHAPLAGTDFEDDPASADCPF